MNWFRSRPDGEGSSADGRGGGGARSLEPDAAELRRRRLAKLASAQQLAEAEKARATAGAVTERSVGTGALNDSCSKEKGRIVRENDQSALVGPKLREKVIQKKVIHPERGKLENEKAAQERERRKKGAMKSKEWWESEIVCRVLGVKLTEGVGRGVYMPDMVEGLRAEMQDSADNDFEPRLKVHHSDEIILNRMSTEPDFLKYMFQCYNHLRECRSDTIVKSKRMSLPENSELKSAIANVLKELSQRLVMYTTLSFSGDMMEEARKARPEDLAKAIMADKVPSGFIPLLIKWYLNENGPGREEMRQVFLKVFKEIRERMRSAKLSASNWLPPLRALASLINSQERELCYILVSDPSFISKEKPQSLPWQGILFASGTYLGPFFQLSVVAGLPIHNPILAEDPAVSEMYFSDPTTRTKLEVDSSIESLRESLKVYRQHLRHVCKELCRAGGEAREAMLQWFGTALNINRKRSAMQVDHMLITGDGFIMNVMDVLLYLCEPIIAPGWKKLNLIDPTYPQSDIRIDYTDETRLAADSDMLKRWWVDKRNFDAQQSLLHQMARVEREAASSSGKEDSTEGSSSEAPMEVSTSFNFVTEIFFLTLRAVQLGFVSLTTMYRDTLLQSLARLQSKIQSMESRFASQGSSTEQDEELSQAKTQFEKLLQIKLTYDVYLLDPHQLSNLIRFVAGDAAFLLRVLSEPPREKFLPLPVPPQHVFASLPEHTIEVISTVMLTGARVNMKVVDENSNYLDSLLTFFIAAASSPLHVKNPYLRAKLIEFLYHVVPRVSEFDDLEPTNQDPAMEALFAGHKLAVTHLPSTLFKLYVDVELTGSHSQFFDKFSIRYHIGYIIESTWRFPGYRESLRREARDESRFIRFVNMLLNDVNFLLDETLNDLEEISRLEHLMADRRAWNALSESDKEEKADRLEQIQQSCASYNQLSANSLNILRLFTGDDAVRAVFLRAEMVSRLVEMLNYLLSKLCGPRLTSLKVLDREKVKWRPRFLLTSILKIYVNFSDPAEFAKAVAKDGRSYSEELFARAVRIALNRKLLHPEDIAKFRTVAENAKAALEDERKDEDILGDVPDEFLDPIMNTLMRDPVKLVTSGNVVDRGTITRHLLSVPSDPFNRKYLDEKMLVDDTELKARIDEFIRKRTGRQD